MTKRELLSVLILASVVLFGLYRYVNREYTEFKSQYIMDTIVEISASSKHKTVGREIDSVFAYIREMDAKLNEYDPNSLISIINNSDEENFPMDADIYAMLVIADSLYRFSQGGFDISIKPLFDIWHFNADSVAVPNSELIDEQMKKVGFDMIRFDKDTLYKPHGMQITFGAIAKGYIIDKAREYMLSIGLDKGYINSRSSISFFGMKIPQVVYVQHPRKMDDFIASFRLKNLAVSTSGDYQQYFELDGVRYHHILNPKTGFPVENMHSVTVIHESSAWADGLSTALFLMDPNAIADHINQMPSCDAIIYYNQDGTIVSLKTNGMKDMNLSEKL